MNELLTRPQVEAMLGVKKSAIYQWMRERDFPTPIRLSPRAVRWKASEIEKWLAAQPRAEGDAA